MDLTFIGIMIFMLFIVAAAGIMLWTLNRKPKSNLTVTAPELKRMSQKKKLS